MAYAEKVPSPKGAYWRGRYKDGGTLANGRPSYATVRDDHGAVIRYKLKRTALKAAQDAESDVRNNRVPAAPDGPGMTFGQFSSTWYAALDLAPRTMARYRSDLVLHLLPRFESDPLAEILETDVSEWEKRQRAAGWAKNTVDGWRDLLGMILGDAVPRHIPVNPAARKKNRGKRSVAPEDAPGRREAKDTGIVVGPLTALLIAERMAILSGRDDELVMTVLLFYAGLRVGEAIGFEAEHFLLSLMKVQWQLGEVTEPGEEADENGDPRGVLRVLRMVPKAGSRRDADLPPFLSELLSAHIARTAPVPCACHGHAYVFRGLGTRRGAVSTAAIARRAGVSPATAARVIAGAERVSPALRARVITACREMGVPGGPPRDLSPHWWVSTLEEHFTAAASGRWPARRRDGALLPARPVMLAGPWPGTRTRSARKADLEWEPLAAGLTPHGLRHSHKSHMIELRVPEVMSEHRLGHRIPGMAGVYSHPTDVMRAELMTLLQSAWEASLDERLALSPSSPVAVLEGLLRARAAAREKVRPSATPERALAKAPVRRLRNRNA